MREILFRGMKLPAHSGFWVFGNLIQDGERYFIDQRISKNKSIEKNGNDAVMIEVVPESVGQEINFYGYFDGIRFKFFEGDIVVCNHKFSKDDKEKMVGMWNESKGGFGLGMDCEDIRQFEKLKLIGNIVDNPELLEIDDEL